MAGALLMEISQDEHARAKLRSQRMFETDQISNILTAEDRKAKTIARNLKSDGFPLEVIAKNTGLSLAEVEKL